MKLPEPSTYHAYIYHERSAAYIFTSTGRIARYPLKTNIHNTCIPLGNSKIVYIPIGNSTESIKSMVKDKPYIVIKNLKELSDYVQILGLA